MPRNHNAKGHRGASSNTGRKMSGMSHNVCRDPNCDRTICPFAHPVSVHSVSAPVNPVKNSVLPMRKPCKFGNKCFNRGRGCAYWHIGEPRTDEKCQFGIRCNRGNCWYQHPDGRVIDGTAHVPDCPFWIRWTSCPHTVCHDSHPGLTPGQCRRGIYCSKLVYTPETERWTCICGELHLDKQIPDWFRRQDELIYELDAFEKTFSITNTLGSRLRRYYIDSVEERVVVKRRSTPDRRFDPNDNLGYNRGLYGDIVYG